MIDVQIRIEIEKEKIQNDDESNPYESDELSDNDDNECKSGPDYLHTNTFLFSFKMHCKFHSIL